MAQRQCIASARRLALQHEKLWQTERSAAVRRIAQSPQTEQRRCLSVRSQVPLQSKPNALRPHGTLQPRSSAPKTIRPFTTTPHPRHGDLTPPKPGFERHVTFIDKEGASHTFTVSDGDNLLDIAQANDLEMEGACGGSCACSTCHVIVADVEGKDGMEGQSADEMFDKMEEPSDDENDMLDLAFGLTETSRLGCQVVMSKELDGLVVKLPSMTRNMQASDFADKK